MFFQAILFDNLLQLHLSFLKKTISDPFSYISISILEYIFRIYFIGLFIPIYLFTKHQKFSIIKFTSWIFILMSGATNIIDKIFYYNFSLQIYQIILLFWLFVCVIYSFGFNLDNSIYHPTLTQRNLVNEEESNEEDDEEESNDDESNYEESNDDEEDNEEESNDEDIPKEIYSDEESTDENSTLVEEELTNEPFNPEQNNNEDKKNV